MIKVLRSIYRWSLAEGVRAKMLFSAALLPWRVPLLFSLSAQERGRKTAMEKMGMKPRVGLAIAIILFILFAPPTAKMYIPATKVVLKHSQGDVVKTLLQGTPLEGMEKPIAGIGATNIQLILEKSQEVKVKVPKDFFSSGIHGIGLSAEGESLKDVIERQVNDLKKPWLLPC